MSERAVFDEREPVQLIYATPRGASVIRMLPPDDEVIARTVRTLRRTARLVRYGITVGEVYRCDDPLHDGHRRGHWGWWFWEYGEHRARAQDDGGER